eukprot:13679658-Heterocapsa_arctica.AAC.1
MSKIAKSKFAKAMFQGGFESRPGDGLTKDELVKNERGKVISQTASADSDGLTKDELFKNERGK